MKQRILFLLLVAASFAGCKKDDDPVFDQTPDERLNATLTNYQNILTGATNGWKALLYPEGGGTYFFYLKFNNQNRVKMYSTFDSTSAVNAMESSYRLKALQQPSLIFDTYSYIHVLSDPNPNVNGGAVGQGLQSDFEFAFESATADTVKLVGRFNGSKMTLIKATAQEAASFDNRGLAVGFVFDNISKYLNYFKRATINGVNYEISVNTNTHTITFTWIDGNGNLKTFTTGYYYSSTGINFSTPFVSGSQTITGFTNITWDAGTQTLGFSANGNATTVVGANQPIKIDLDAPKRWWQFSVSNGDFWVSENGFHVNGVDDAYNWKSVPNFLALIYLAQAGTSGTVTYDAMGPFIGTTIPFFTAYRPPNFTADGRVIFTNFGTGGTVPANATAAFLATRTQMTSTQGFYVVQTGPLSYDMVSAADSKIWITWEW